MRTFFITVAAATLFASSPAVGADGPFSRAELVAYLKTNIPYWADANYDAACSRAAETVSKRGISFAYDGSFDAELHQAGACQLVLSAMQRSGTRAASVASTKTGHVAPGRIARETASAGATKAVPTSQPRTGRYKILSYGNVMNPLLIGYVELRGNGAYTVLDRGARPVASGSYSLGDGGVIWKTGLYAANYKRSPFEVRRGGKDHVLRLNRVTIAVHSTDSR